MNESAILHIPDSQYCFAVGEKKLVIRLRMAKEDADASVTLIYAGKYQFQQSREQIPMEIRYTDRLYHYYETTLVLTDVRLAYVFCIRQQGTTYYFCEDGVVLQYDFAEGFYNFFQMPYINRNDVLPTVKWMKSAVFYQIFVDRFFCGNTKKDRSYINMEWGALPTPKSFAGGDLCGIIEKLDYLKDLGITAIYLTPIFRSISNHKYDTMDYMQIDPQFGTKEEFGELVRMAHAHGIRIVLDAVFNHCSMQMQQFCDVMEKGAESPYYDWFLIDGAYPVPSRANYECFAECTYMPKLDTANREVQEYLIGIACYWIREYGIDGWRLDVVDELPDAFLARLRARIRAYKPDALLIGEVWEDASNKIAYDQRRRYFTDRQLDSVMNYPWQKAILRYVRSEDDGTALGDAIRTLAENYPPDVLQTVMNILSTHDTPRAINAILDPRDGDRTDLAQRHFTQEQLREGRQRLKLAAFLQFMLPGMPCIYYGDEAGMTGYRDPFNRKFYPWGREDGNLVSFYRSLARVKKSAPALRSGTVLVLEAGGGRLLLLRQSAEGSVAVCCNQSPEPWTLPHSGTILLGGGIMEYTGETVTLGQGGFCAMERE